MQNAKQMQLRSQTACARRGAGPDSIAHAHSAGPGTPGGLLEGSWSRPGGPRGAPEQLWRPLGGVLEAWEHLRGVLVAPGAFAESSWSHLGTLVGPNGSHFGGLLGALFGILFETPFSTRFFVQWALFLGPFWARFLRVSECTQGLLARRCHMQKH